MGRWDGPRRRPRTPVDGGFTVVEVMAAMLIFVIVTVASLTILINGMRTIRESNDRVYAAALARSEVDRLRGLGSYALTPGAVTSEVVVDGRTFTVTTSSEWIPIPVGATTASATCASGNVLSDPNRSYARVRVEVAGGNLPGPQALDAVILPNETTAISNVGTVTATVVDQAGARLGEASITMVNSATGQTLQFATDPQGCVYARNVPVAAQYVATVSKPGYVSKNPTAAQLSGAVLADQNTPFAFAIARAGSATFTAGTAEWPIVQQVPFTLVPPGTASLPANVPTVVTDSPFTVDTLWPDPAAYTAWLGCSDAQAYANSVAVAAGAETAVTLGGTKVEVIGPKRSEITIRHAATASGACTSPITLSLGTTGARGKLKATMPYGTWTLKAGGVEDKVVALTSGTTSPCSVALRPIAPAITSITPNTINIAGGIDVTINGTNLTGVTSVKFGPLTALIKPNTNTATAVTVTAPSGVVGPADVSLTAASGSTTETGAVTYVATGGATGSWTPDVDTPAYPTCPAS